jgi:hypothetical protein
MTFSLLFNNDGTINGISSIASEYPSQCPDFINFENFTQMKCINLSDHLNPDSWVVIEN